MLNFAQLHERVFEKAQKSFLLPLESAHHFAQFLPLLRCRIFEHGFRRGRSKARSKASFAKDRVTLSTFLCLCPCMPKRRTYDFLGVCADDLIDIGLEQFHILFPLPRRHPKPSVRASLNLARPAYAEVHANHATGTIPMAGTCSTLPSSASP